MVLDWTIKGSRSVSSTGEDNEHARRYWENYWGTFEGKWSERELSRAQAICSMIPRSVTSVLEVGCGDGLVINRVTAQDTMGTDISAAGLSSVRGPSLQCSSDDLPFRDERYELVIASEVLEHLPDDVYEQSLAEIARVSGRYILISVPNRENLKANLTRCPACGLWSTTATSTSARIIHATCQGSSMVSRWSCQGRSENKSREGAGWKCWPAALSGRAFLHLGTLSAPVAGPRTSVQKTELLRILTEAGPGKVAARW